jgi:hypothetical protein
VNVFSIDPYQVGHENEEGIDSGAFWFYRKLGFYPVRLDLMKLTLLEERRVLAEPGRRTSARMLRKLAAGPMLFEMPGTDDAHRPEWDRFQIHNVGLAIQKRMAREFKSDAQSIRAHALNFVERSLGLQTLDWPTARRASFEKLAQLLAMMPIDQWGPSEKQLAARILRAKASADEALYLKLMQKHSLLRAAVIRLGS